MTKTHTPGRDAVFTAPLAFRRMIRVGRSRHRVRSAHRNRCAHVRSKDDRADRPISLNALAEIAPLEARYGPDHYSRDTEELIHVFRLMTLR